MILVISFSTAGIWYACCTQVMKLGVLRVLGRKIPDLLRIICGKGAAHHGSVADVTRAMNDRILHLGRMCLASRASPGYVVTRLAGAC